MKQRNRRDSTATAVPLNRKHLDANCEKINCLESGAATIQGICYLDGNRTTLRLRPPQYREFVATGTTLRIGRANRRDASAARRSSHVDRWGRTSNSPVQCS